MIKIISESVFLGFDLTDWVFWVVLGSVAVALLAVILIIVFALRANKKTAGKTAQKITIKDGVRYSEDKTIEVGKSVNVTHNQGDFALVKGKTYTARKGGKNGDLLPGQYTVLTSARGEDKFNIRLGGFMREYTHGDAIIIPDGESISCTSHSVILR